MAKRDTAKILKQLAWFVGGIGILVSLVVLAPMISHGG
ncbi:hypothetical protein MCBRY_000158 [Methylocystis bryophila]